MTKARVTALALPVFRDGLLDLAEVMQMTKLVQSDVYSRMAAKTFPCPVQLGPRKVAWRAAEVLDWVAALPRQEADAPGEADQAA